MLSSEDVPVVFCWMETVVSDVDVLLSSLVDGHEPFDDSDGAVDDSTGEDVLEEGKKVRGSLVS